MSAYIYTGQIGANGNPVLLDDPRDCNNYNTEPWLYYDTPFSSACFHRYGVNGETLHPPPTPYYLHSMKANELGETVEGYMHFPPGTSPYGQYLNPAIMRFIDPADLVTPQALADKAKWEAATGTLVPASVTVSNAVATQPPVSTSEKIAANVVTTAPGTPGAVSSSPSIWDRLVTSIAGGGESVPAAPASGLAAIPTWAWLAGGTAALYFFMGRGK